LLSQVIHIRRTDFVLRLNATHCEEITGGSDIIEDHLSLRPPSNIRGVIEADDSEDDFGVDDNTLNTELHGEGTVNTDPETEREIIDFEQAEEDTRFHLQERGLQHLRCFSHLLQLVVSFFDNIRKKRSSLPKFTQAILSAKKLFGKFNHSTVATQKLLVKTGKKLRADVVTRWSSTYLLIERLLQLKKEVGEVANETEMDNLSNTDWKLLDNVKCLLEPFADYTQLLTATKATTISCVIPAVLTLKMHLEKVSFSPFEIHLFQLIERFSYLDGYCSRI
jgi:hypothetical protein